MILFYITIAKTEDTVQARASVHLYAGIIAVPVPLAYLCMAAWTRASKF